MQYIYRNLVRRVVAEHAKKERRKIKELVKERRKVLKVYKQEAIA
jgi:hypothetical protein